LHIAAILRKSPEKLKTRVLINIENDYHMLSPELCLMYADLNAIITGLADSPIIELDCGG